MAHPLTLMQRLWCTASVVRTSQVPQRKQVIAIEAHEMRWALGATHTSMRAHMPDVLEVRRSSKCRDLPGLDPCAEGRSWRV